MMSEMKETDLGLLPKSWDLQVLGDLLYIKGRIGWKGLKKAEYLEEGYAIINGDQIKNDKVNWNSVGRISKDRFLESPEIILKRKDILMTKDGTIGKIAFVDHLPEDATVASGVFVIRKDSKLLHTKYLYNFFKSRYFKRLIKGRTEGSVIPHLYQRDFKEMMIPLPSFKEQKAIAKVLTAFDDKIELLQAQNKTLEIMAQTIFKEWFGKYKIGDELPEGWRVGELNDLIDRIIDNRGKTPPLTLKTENVFPLIEVNSINGINRTVNQNLAKKFVDDQTYNNWFRKGHPVNRDVLFSTVGSIGQLSQVFNEKICIAQNVVAIRSKQSGDFLYALMKYYQKQIIKLDISSVQPSIKIPHLLSFPIVIPNSYSIKKFDDSSRALSEKIAINSKQIQSLTKTRDTLLPKLMSGQVRVKNIKQTADA